MDFKGTKGKWFSCCLDSKPHYCFANDGEITICGFYKKQDIGRDLSDEELRANALLISKAPEMLEMLQEYISAISEITPQQKKYSEKVKQLIKEATELKS
jgi:hypothetical protein